MLRMSRSTRRKRQKVETAASGGSSTLLAARLGRPGGTHGRRKPVRGAVKRAAITEQ